MQRAKLLQMEVLYCGCVSGEKEKSLAKIFDLYIDKCRKFNINTVVFDGYNKSTKDATQKERSNKMSQVVENSDAYPSD